MMQSTSSSMFGACHASVTRLTGRPGTKMGASRREPIYARRLGSASAASTKRWPGDSPPMHTSEIDGCRLRKSATGPQFGERSTMEEKVTRFGKKHS